MRRLPTLKDKLHELAATEPSCGLLGYPVLQSADILVVQGDLVPVGPDQRSHIELAREIARSFNRSFGMVFPEPTALTSEIGILPGIDGGPKMSRSLGNTIDLFDDAHTVSRKVMGMYTDPTRLRATDPGHVQANPVFAFHDAFNEDRGEVADLKERYRAGRVGDVEVKRRLVSVLETFFSPIRDRRDELEREQPSIVDDVLAAGTTCVREEASHTLQEVREAMRLDYFGP